MGYPVSGNPVKIKRRLLFLLLAISLTRGCIYAAIVPPWQAPDENGHFEHAWLIAHLGRLPRPGEASSAFEIELLSSLYEWRYGEFIGRPLPSQMPARLNDLPGGIFALGSRSAVGRFSLAYIWVALFIWPFRHQDLLMQLYAARLASVTLNLGIVWLAWSIFQQLLPRQPDLAAAMTAFVIFLPQHTFINASVCEGPMAELGACMVLYGWLCLVLKGRMRGIIAIIVGTLLGMWAKATALFLLPFNAVATILFLWHVGSKQTQRRQALYRALAVLGVLVLLVWGIWQTPAGKWIYNLLKMWWSDPRIYWENERVSLYEALRYTFESFWAQFGWMSVRAGYGWYLLIYILVAFAVEGWILPRSRPWSAPNRAMWLLAGALLFAVVGFIAFMVMTPTGLYYYQGRYLFPVTVPVAFFIIGGWARCIPPYWQDRFPPAVLILLAAIDTNVFASILLPYFYK